MKKNIFVIGTALLATTLLFSCSKEQAEELAQRPPSGGPIKWGADWMINPIETKPCTQLALT